MSKVEPQRAALRAVIPMLICRDGASEIEFCKSAFGAVELSRRAGEGGIVVHATLAIGGAMIMIHGEFSGTASRAPQPDGSSSVVIYLYVEDVDATIAQAVGAGAKVLIPAADLPWGDRTGRIVDSSGHVWNVATRVESTPNRRSRVICASVQKSPGKSKPSGNS